MALTLVWAAVMGVFILVAATTIGDDDDLKRWWRS
jgi:hypothetical protein